MPGRAWKAIAVLFVTDAVLAGATAALLVGGASRMERQPAVVVDPQPVGNPGPAAGSVPVEEARLAPAATDAPSTTTTTTPPTTTSRATATLPPPPSVTAATTPQPLVSTTTTAPVDTTPTTTTQPVSVPPDPGDRGP
jgi:hypothetical protein